MLRLMLAAALLALAMPASTDDQWVGFGSGACTMCHADTHAGTHAGLAATAGPGNACESCHGPSAAHLVVGPDGVRPPPPGPTDTQCATCHADVGSLHWPHSAHARAGVSCTDCHVVHVPRDPAGIRAAQFDRCTDCHQDVASAFHRPSSHPVLSGALACTDCHNPHGSRGDAALVRDSVNETCYACHADLRGPFLWEHPPVREDCSTCHLPHGSVHDKLMTARTPYLCQQCHLAQFHPSVALSGTTVPPSGASSSMLLRNCMNCHTQVHGSNHPSGVRQTR
ncbi:MAG: DmsE family decaheme c-type cytochrome [Xanthomonadaceae bacterium]|nr:DmsE family decaheme c-type cytochrome [Xanthomonadaceae bacterium]